MKKLISFLLSLTVLCGTIISANAVSSNQTITNKSDAIEFLRTFHETYIDSDGFTVDLTIPIETMSTADLDRAAESVLEIGAIAFRDGLLASANIPQSPIAVPHGSKSLVVSLKEGNNPVSDSWYVTASLPNNLALEYYEKLGMTVVLKNGVISGVNKTSFTCTNMSTGGSFSDVTMTTYYNNSAATLKVEYKLTKTLSYANVPISYSSNRTASLVVLNRAS